jgi:hypothetical protein
MREEKFEERNPPIYRRKKDIVRGPTDNRRASGKEVPCNLHITSFQGKAETMMKEGRGGRRRF